MELIGPAIDHYRSVSGLSQLALAERLGINQGNLSRLLAGKQDITCRRLFQVADALGIKASEVVVYAESGGDHTAPGR